MSQLFRLAARALQLLQDALTQSNAITLAALRVLDDLSCNHLRKRVSRSDTSAPRKMSRLHPRIFGKYGNAGEAEDQCQYAYSEHRCRPNQSPEPSVISFDREIGNLRPG
jgi:hypothetical protein